MDPVQVAEAAPGEYFLSLEAGTTNVDDLISELGHEPNGYFWEGIVELLVAADAPTLEGRFLSDPESGAFYATSDNRETLDELAALLHAVASDSSRLRQLVEFAKASGFEFND